jgi:quinol monooxygenase YgiN
MIQNRREFVGSAAVALLAASAWPARGDTMEELYGLIGEMKAAPGKRAELVTLLLQGTGAMPGNLAYLVAEDLQNDDSIWITEVWRSREDHAASLQLPQIRDTIDKARPLIAGFTPRAETRPVNGAGNGA